MSQYIITIVPVEDDDFTGPATQITVKVETSGGRPAVTELTMRAPVGAGLGSGELPNVDFETLLSAFLPRDARPAAREVAREAIREARAEGRSDSREAPSESRSEGRAIRAEAATAKAAKKAPARSTNAKRTGTKVTHLPAGRAYRKAPEIDELEAAYAETGTISGVAEHFGVPVHTAQGWISRLRRKGAGANG
jgi:hypothetical protein